jgi:hypothetical protein
MTEFASFKTPLLRGEMVMAMTAEQDGQVPMAIRFFAVAANILPCEWQSL